MGRERRKKPAAVENGPKERHMRALRLQDDPSSSHVAPQVARPAMAKPKHHSYYELVENADKKKKLDYQIVNKKTPPPGFEFVPIGNPILTTACKELSRDKDAMIFIVSDVASVSLTDLSKQMHRVGHHFRETIVEEARANISEASDQAATGSDGELDAIPQSQAEYNAQVDAAIRDLFPRIPNPDRQTILDHSFSLTMDSKGKQRVGQQANITLARRVQLAVLAHIRHTHTRYDELLKTMGWANARKEVETPCLDVLVKWRGDEETGRDQLDEILREVIVISDSGSESSDGEDNDDLSDGEEEVTLLPQPPASNNGPLASINTQNGAPSYLASGRDLLVPPPPGSRPLRSHHAHTAAKKNQRGFKRYRAWQEAIERNRTNASVAYTAGSNELSFAPRQPSPVRREPWEVTDRHIPRLPVTSDIHVAYPSTTPGPYVNEHRPESRNQQTSAIYVGPSRETHIYERLPLDSRTQLDSAVYTHGAARAVAPRLERPDNRSSVPRAISPLTDRFQDLLVPSIEPISPDIAQPSFVRALPAFPAKRRLVLDQPSLQAEPGFQVRPRSPHRDVRPLEEYPRKRRVISDNPAGHGASWVVSTEYQEAGRPQAWDRDSDLPSQSNHHRVPIQPFHEPRGYDADYLSRSHVPHVPSNYLRDAPVSGERPPPILMQDRGGFYERVPVSLHAVPPSGSRVVEGPLLVQGPPHFPEPHRDDAWQQTRIVHDLQGRDSIQAIPIPRPSGTRHHARHASLGPVIMQRDGQHASAPGRAYGERPMPVYRENPGSYLPSSRLAEEVLPPSRPLWQSTESFAPQSEPRQYTDQPRAHGGIVYRAPHEPQPPQHYRHAPDDVTIID